MSFFLEKKALRPGTRTPALWVQPARLTQVSQAPRKPATRGKNANTLTSIISIVYEQANDQRASTICRAASRGGAGLDVLKGTKNGQSSRADGGSMGPNALDQENGIVLTSVRSHHISRGRHCVPRLWK